MARAYIGPKAQTQVPQEVANWIEEELSRRRQTRGPRVKEAEVVRDLIMAGYEERRNIGKAKWSVSA